MKFALCLLAAFATPVARPAQLPVCRPNVNMQSPVIPIPPVIVPLKASQAAREPIDY
jgi:hypothetical protein